MTIREILTDNGFIKFKPDMSGSMIPSYSCYKPASNKTHTLCQTNNKLSIHATVYTFNDVESIKISIVAETEDELWIDMAFYSMSVEDISEPGALERIEDKLISAWEALNK